MKRFLFIVGSVLCLASCDNTKQPVQEESSSNETKYDTAASGLVYRKISEGQGRKIEVGEVAILHLAGYAEGGQKELINTWSSKAPIHVHIGSGQVVPGLDEGLSMMNVGDSYEFIIPPKLAFGKDRIVGIPSNKELIYQAQLLGLKESGHAIYDTTGITPEMTGSGLEIYWLERTEENRPEPGELVTVHYSGYLVNGKKFDSSYDRGEPIKLEVGKGQVIMGWEEVLQLMRKGEKVKVRIPYHLAYGENGLKGIIPMKSDLMFDIELIDIEK